MKTLHQIITVISIMGIGITVTSVIFFMPGILIKDSEENLTSLYDLISRPYKYKDETVTIKSYYQGDKHADWAHWIKESGQRLYFKIKNLDSCPVLIMDAQYYFTGTLRFLENHSYVQYYLEDTEVKPIEPLPERSVYSRAEIGTHAYQLLGQEITTVAIYVERTFSRFFTDFEDLGLIDGAEYLITGYLFVDSTYGFPHLYFRVTEAKPVL